MSGVQCCLCEEKTTNGDSVKCVTCESVFHVACVKGRKPRANTKGWRCEQCDPAKQVSEEKSAASGDDNEILKAIRALDSKFEAKLNTMQSSLDNLTLQITQLNASVEAVKKENEELKKDQRSLRRENEELRQEIADLSGKVQDLQYSRIDNLEISGVPVTQGEDVYKVLEAVAQALSVPYSGEEIAIAHRLRSRKDNRQPSIVVKFISRRTKLAWLTAARGVKINAADIHPSFSDKKPVYVNEHLTVHGKMLLGRARALKQDGRLAYAWVSNARILVRKTDQDQAVRITSFGDLDDLLKD